RPTRIREQLVKDAVSRPYDRLRRHRVGKANARRETFVINLFGVGTSQTCTPSLVSRKDQAAGPVIRPRVRAVWINIGYVVIFVARWRGKIPADSVVESQFRSYLPGVAAVDGQIFLADVLSGQRQDRHAGVVNIA